MTHCDGDRNDAKTFNDDQIQANVLVMDDQQAILDFTSEVLDILNCNVTTASNGNQAFDIFKKSWNSPDQFDVVLLDLLVPGFMGGKESLAKMIEIDPDVAAIAMSGYCDDPIMKDCSRYGFKAAIPKPFEMHDLEKILRDCLSSRSKTAKNG